MFADELWRGGGGEGKGQDSLESGVRAHVIL